MTVYCYADLKKPKSRRLSKLFAAGCDGVVLIGHKVPAQGEAFLYGVTQWQVGLWNKIQAAKLTYYYADNAYAPAPDGTELFRITRNRMQVSGIGPGDPVRRDLYMPRIKPWQTGGRNILVCMQSDHHHRLFGMPQRLWLSEVMEALEKHTDRPVIVRDKPLRNPNIPPFSEAIKDAWAVICHTSRVANEALLAGVPAFVTGECAASPMANTDLAMIETPWRPDGREEWAAHLAANQWTVPEIVSGVAYEHLKKTED